MRKFVWKILTILLHRYQVFDYYGKLGRYCTFCRGGIFEKRESELSSRFRASTVPHRRYLLEPVFRTKLCKTGTQQVPSRVPRYYYILVSKGSGIGVLKLKIELDNHTFVTWCVHVHYIGRVNYFSIRNLVSEF